MYAACGFGKLLVVGSAGHDRNDVISRNWLARAALPARG